MVRGRSSAGTGRHPAGGREGRLVDGVVVRIHARHARVHAEGATLRCSIRKGLFFGSDRGSRPLAVGDRVVARVFDGRDGVVEQIQDRRNVLVRSREHDGTTQVLAANVDRVMVTVAVRNPPLKPRLIDRLLVAAEREDLDAAVILNKVDLADDRDRILEVAAVYRILGYPVVTASAVTGEGLDELRALLRDRTSVFAGHSGVGKSSLLNAIQPGLGLRVAEVSRKWDRGRHTTTSASLLPLDGGGFVIDTPGIRAFGLGEMQPFEVALCFRDLRELAPECRYPNCGHTHEPGCAVKDAFAEGRLAPERYESYLRMIDDREDPDDGEDPGPEEDGRETA